MSPVALSSRFSALSPPFLLHHSPLLQFPPPPTLPGERKVFDRTLARQPDCLEEEPSGDGARARQHEVMLGSPPRAEDLPPHDGSSLGEMSSPLPAEHGDMRLDPAAGDGSVHSGVLRT